MSGERRGTEPVCDRRDDDIIALVAQGLTNRDVAAALGTTEYVIKNHLRTIYDKLGLWNRVELALWYEARAHDYSARHGGPAAAGEASLFSAKRTL